MPRIIDSIEVLAPVEHVFRFCTNVGNLPAIFPRDIRVEIIRQPPLPLCAGAEIILRFHRSGITYPWESLVTRCEPTNLFEDVQIQGPMKSWISRHYFDPTAQGTLVRHEIDYQYHFGALGLMCGLMALDHILRSTFRYIHRETKYACEAQWKESGDDRERPKR